MATVPFTNQYSEDLFGCFDDINTCVYGFCCTPCLVGQSAEDANVGKCFDTACCLVAWNCIPYVGGCISACKTAEIMNKSAQAYGVTESVEWCPTIMFCGACAACRLQREINKRKAAGMQPVVAVMVVPAPQQMQQAPTQK
mmetsp:Transcript_7051/g.23644  ORF Transcript_7051/g.23644 Transcript_7051/m.23644 type:complete len:141 (-) Transcript_7051:186-608(-)